MGDARDGARGRGRDQRGPRDDRGGRDRSAPWARDERGSRPAPRDERGSRGTPRGAPRAAPHDDRAAPSAPVARKPASPERAPPDHGPPQRHKGSTSDSERVVVGKHPVTAVLEHQRDRALRLHHLADVVDVAELAKEVGVPTSIATLDQLSSRAPAGVPHQGVVLECAPFPYVDLEDLSEAPDITLVLDGVEDPRNFGAAARAAFALGASLVIVPADRSAPASAAAYKASAGALAQLAVARPQNLRRALDWLKEKGAWLVGAEADGKATPWSVDMTGKVVLVIGGEDRGLRRLTRESCDHVVAIPMATSQTSLNAADAATVLLYEALRQRRAAASSD